MSDETEAIASFIQHYIDENHEFLSWLGVTVEEVEEGRMTMAIPYKDRLTNKRPNGGDRRADIHGGVAATLIDTVGGMAQQTTIENPQSTEVATINLNVNYLRPATGDLLAIAEVVRTGSSVGVSHVVVESTTPDGETREVATGQGAYRIFRGD